MADDRLCWLAVRDQLGKKARKVGLFGWTAALLAGTAGWRSGTAAGVAGDMRREAATERMFDCAFAVDAAAEALSADERKHLRATGEFPDWFLADVERRAADIRERQ